MLAIRGASTVSWLIATNWAGTYHTTGGVGVTYNLIVHFTLFYLYLTLHYCAHTLNSKPPSLKSFRMPWHFPDHPIDWYELSICIVGVPIWYIVGLVQVALQIHDAQKLCCRVHQELFLISLILSSIALISLILSSIAPLNVPTANDCSQP